MCPEFDTYLCPLIWTQYISNTNTICYNNIFRTINLTKNTSMCLKFKN